MAERSFDDIRRMIGSAIKPPLGNGANNTYVWVRDVYADWFVFEQEVAGVSKLYKASYSIDDGNVVTVGTPEVVSERTVYEPVIQMASFPVLSAAIDENWVEWSGKIFEAADYGNVPGWGIQVSEEDLDAMVAGFEPVELNLEHLQLSQDTETVLDGKLGFLTEIWRKGKDLLGKARVPKWLDEILSPEQRKVSIEITRAAKQVVGLALVLNPLVPDAALAAALCAHARPKHDVAPPEGAKTPVSSGSNPAAPSANGGTKKMNLLQRFTALFSSGRIPKELEEQIEGMEVPDPAASSDKPDAQAPNPESAEFKAKLESLETQMAAAAEATLRERAKTFAESQVAAHKAVPAQLEQITGLYVQAVKADAAGKALFASDGALVEGEAVKALKELFAKTPEHIFTGTLTADGKLFALGTATGEGLSPEREKELLGATPEGRAILAERKKEAK